MPHVPSTREPPYQPVLRILPICTFALVLRIPPDFPLSSTLNARFAAFVVLRTALPSLFLPLQQRAVSRVSHHPEALRPEGAVVHFLSLELCGAPEEHQLPVAAPATCPHSLRNLTACLVTRLHRGSWRCFRNVHVVYYQLFICLSRS